jgi:hypothetical protein
MTPFALAFGGLFALVGLISLTAAWLPVWNDYRHGKQFAAKGALASGMVLTKSRASAGSVMALGYTKQLIDYSVRYRFSTHSGQKIEGDAKVTPQEWGLLEERGFIKVRYLPEDPETNHVSGQESSRSRMETLIFTLVGAVFTAIGGLVVFIVLKNDQPAR